jgi:hypothetical protein
MRSALPSILIYPLAVTLGLSLLPGGKYALYPFRLFSTWVHECCHAFTALLVGGSVNRIILSANTGGLTDYRIPAGRIRQGLVTSAGYLGSSAIGCLFYHLSLASHRNAHLLILAVGALMLLSLLFWIRNLFGALAVASLGTGMLALGWQGRPSYSEPLLAFLAIQTSLNALFDIRTLFGLESDVRSDARTMQTLCWFPAWFWAALWLSLSLALTIWVISK